MQKCSFITALYRQTQECTNSLRLWGDLKKKRNIDVQKPKQIISHFMALTEEKATDVNKKSKSFDLYKVSSINHFKCTPTDTCARARTQ